MIQLCWMSDKPWLRFYANCLRLSVYIHKVAKTEFEKKLKHSEWQMNRPNVLPSTNGTFVRFVTSSAARKPRRVLRHLGTRHVSAEAGANSKITTGLYCCGTLLTLFPGAASQNVNKLGGKHSSFNMHTARFLFCLYDTSRCGAADWLIRSLEHVSFVVVLCHGIFKIVRTKTVLTRRHLAVGGSRGIMKYLARIITEVKPANEWWPWFSRNNAIMSFSWVE